MPASEQLPGHPPTLVRVRVAAVVQGARRAVETYGGGQPSHRTQRGM
jgi:hypothetical protein